MSNRKVIFPISIKRIATISKHVHVTQYSHLINLTVIDELTQLRQCTEVFAEYGHFLGCYTNTRLLRIAALAHPLLYKHQLTIPELQAMTVLHNNFHKTICMKSVLLKVRLGIEP